MSLKKYLDQAKLMLRILPLVAKEDCFALKGGTAINFFVRDMPRLSVDIDLVYLPIEGRKESLKKIGQALDHIAQAIMPICKVESKKSSDPIGDEDPLAFTSKLFAASKEGIVKIEPNTTFRGSVLPPEKRTLIQAAQDKFELSTAIATLSVSDLYGGKLCAALDRQHPRDLFDVKILFENEGFSPEIRQAFVLYLAGHNRPMHELLDPNLKEDIRKKYDAEFQGMTEVNVPCEALLQYQRELPKRIREQLSENDKNFLISIKEGTPRWDLLGMNEIERLPALQWKLQNIRDLQKKDKRKWKNQLKKLESALNN